MQHWEYVGIYRTTILEGEPQKVIIGDIKIELLPLLPREWQVAKVNQRIAPKGRDSTLAQGAVLRLERPERLIVITVRTLEENPQRSRDLVEAQLDRAITALSVCLSPTIFERQIYRGWIQSRRGLKAAVLFRSVPPFRVPRDDLPGQLERLHDRLLADPERRLRFDLMSRLYSKALTVDPSEEQFLLLWTVLEVFPMKDTTNIRPISEFLGRELNLPPEVVKQSLGLGRLYGYRCSLVHDGTLGANWNQLRLLLSKTEHICHEVLRLYSGVGYGGSLDEYLE